MITKKHHLTLTFPCECSGSAPTHSQHLANVLWGDSEIKKGIVLVDASETSRLSLQEALILPVFTRNIHKYMYRYKQSFPMDETQQVQKATTEAPVKAHINRQIKEWKAKHPSCNRHPLSQQHFHTNLHFCAMLSIIKSPLGMAGGSAHHAKLTSWETRVQRGKKNKKGTYARLQTDLLQFA